jgi:formylglycine-generating enzyme required for sulfatase activity
MKKIFYPLLPLLMLLCLSFKNREAKSKMVKISERIYVCETEVSNKEYREFLNALLAANATDKYAKCLYDSARWKDALTFSTPLTEYYHRHVAYNDYPVVNITQQAMEYYCEWLGEKYARTAGKKFKRVVFRLPNDGEYKMMIIPFSMQEHSVKKDGQKISPANVKDDQMVKNGETELTAPVYAYKPNKLGLYNIIGNVSEVSKEGHITGGNFTIPMAECAGGQYQTYSLPDARVGFRYVMEVIEY